MIGDPNHLEEAVRETLASLSDRELILRDQSAEYTEFARQAAREELEKRHRVQAAGPNSKQDSTDERRELSPTESGGCYVDLWRDKSYEGEHVRIDGPAELLHLQSNCTEWWSDASSLRVGPCAFVEAYQSEGLTGNMVCFGPNEEVPDLAEIEFDNKLSSFKIISSINIFDGLGSGKTDVDVDMYNHPAREMLKRERVRKKGHKKLPA
jgi:hypothetical protein